VNKITVNTVIELATSSLLALLINLVNWSAIKVLKATFLIKPR